jgi:AcrR family transcriptional regulator
LLTATVHAALEGAETVSRVVRLAGVGRSTFHEFFDDFAHALRAARAQAAKEMQAALSFATRDERWFEAAVSTWMDRARAEPELTLVALRVADERSTSELGSVFATALENVVGDETSARDRVANRSALAVAAAEGCARDVARHARTPAGVSEVDLAEVKHLLAATVQAILAGAPRDKI